MRNGMQAAFGATALSLVLALEAVGQFHAPPQQAPRPAQPQPLPQERPQAAQPAPPQSPSAEHRQFVAAVNGEGITRSELEEQVGTAMQARRQQPGGQAQSTPQELQRLRRQVLANLIEARLIEQHMRDQGPDVATAEVDRVIEAVRKNLQAEGKTLDQYLASREQTAEEFQKRIEGALAWEKFQRQEMSPQNLKKLYEDERQRFGEASFEQVQPQLLQLYSSKLWNDIVAHVKPKAKIEVAEPQPAAPRTSPQEPATSRRP